MFIALARFPQVPADRDTEFQEWFAWSSQQIADADGLLNRRLLRTPDGAYAALVEHDTADSFAAMHTTQVAAEVHSRLREILPEEPEATQFEVVLESGSPACCGGAGGHHHCDHAGKTSPGNSQLGVPGQDVGSRGVGLT